MDPGLGITSAYCICSGSTFSQSADTLVTPANSCAYTTLPGGVITPPIASPTVSTNTADCQVCTIVGPNEDDCSTIPNCTPTPIAQLVVISIGGTHNDGTSVEAVAWDVSNGGFNPDGGLYCASGTEPLNGFQEYAGGTANLPASWSQTGWNFNSDWTNCDFEVEGPVGAGSPEATLTCEGMPDNRSWTCFYSGATLPVCPGPLPNEVYQELFECSA